MAAMLVVVLLVIAATCQGAALPGQDRMKREAIVGRLDKSFDVLGVHMGLQYKDPAHPLKGGKLNLKFDDLKKIFPQARSNKVDLNVNFDGGVAMDDGLFKLAVQYSMVHSDGNGEEKGDLMVERKHVGNLWTTTIKTTTNGNSYSGNNNIIPAAISNIDIKLESDRQTKLVAKYVNPAKNRDIHLHVDRVPGKSLKLEISNGARKHDLTFKVGNFNLAKMDGVFNIEVEGTSLGEAVKGKLIGSKGSKGKQGIQVIQFELEKGNKKFVQLDTKMKVNFREGLAINFETRTKYAVLGGKIAGKLLVKFDESNGEFTVKNTDSASKSSVEFTAKVVPGESLDIEGKKDGESMWTYKTRRSTSNSAAMFKMTINTEMTLSEKSMVHKFLSANYPYGAFKTRTNQIEIFVSRKEKNLFAPKFKIRVDLQKDGNQAVYLTADTSSSPYVFKLDAPNVFKRWGIKQSSIDITVDHKIGSSLVVDANVLGGIHLEGKRGDNAKNGRDVSLMITKGGVQMIKVSWSTEKVNNENEFKFVLRDNIEVSPESLLYKNIISKYKILTPFNSRTGEFEFYVDKKTRNVLLNKFHVKGKVMKDGKKVVDLEVNTIVRPYKFELFAPALLGKLKSGMTEAKISVAHKPGQSLEIKTNFEKFTGLKIYKTGSGNERKVEFNGKELVMGDYTLTDSSFSTKVTLGNDFLEPKITWQGKLPQTKQEAEAFMLQNNVDVKVTGSRRNLDLNLNWKMTKPDFNFGTPENGKISFNAKGNNPNLGEYSLSRDINWHVENKVIDFSLNGMAHFAKGRLATSTPIETSVNFKVLLDKKDLIGKFMKKINGKEYSVDFPAGSGVMPKILWGQ